MKKIMLMAFAAGLFAYTSTSFSSDDDGGGKSCEKLLEEYFDAIEDYGNDPSEENQEDMDNAEDALYDANCDEELGDF
jgi:hypothetical protein